jgi:hypothetical protein
VELSEQEKSSVALSMQGTHARPQHHTLVPPTTLRPRSLVPTNPPAAASSKKRDVNQRPSTTGDDEMMEGPYMRMDGPPGSCGTPMTGSRSLTYTPSSQGLVRPSPLLCRMFLGCKLGQPRGEVSVCSGEYCEVRVCNHCMAHLAKMIPGLDKFVAIGTSFRLCGGCAIQAVAYDSACVSAGDDKSSDNDDDVMEELVMPARRSAGGRR